MKLIGLYEFTPSGEGMRIFQELICTEDAITQPFCSNVLFLIAGFDKEQFNNVIRLLMSFNYTLKFLNDYLLNNMIVFLL